MKLSFYRARQRLPFWLIFLLYSPVISGQYQQALEELPLHSYNNTHYYDTVKDTIIQGCPDALLEWMGVNPKSHFRYGLTGRYQINGFHIIFIKEYTESESETQHYAALLDNEWNYLGTIPTAYDNDEGFHLAWAAFDYNLVSVRMDNTYSGTSHEYYIIGEKGFRKISVRMVIRAQPHLNMREAPTTNSEIIDRLPDGTILDGLPVSIEMPSKGNVWYQIRFNGQEGYVSREYLDLEIKIPADYFDISISATGKSGYLQYKERMHKENPPEKITNTQRISELLGLVYKVEEDGYSYLAAVPTPNGDIKEEWLADCGTRAYFTEYGYLLLECGHSSDWIIDMQTGDNETELLGNPEYYQHSPNRDMRVNGYYTGQSSQYFLEDLSRDKVIMGLAYPFLLPEWTDVFWLENSRDIIFYDEYLQTCYRVHIQPRP